MVERIHSYINNLQEFKCFQVTNNNPMLTILASRNYS